jgi:hypothetical protein
MKNVMASRFIGSPRGILVACLLVSANAYLTLRAESDSPPASAEASAPTLHLLRNTFSPGEEIDVSFTAPASYPQHAWLGIVPSQIPHGSEVVNDQNSPVYEFLDFRTSGIVKLKAPDRPGAYDIRLNSSDDSHGKEVASVSFTVVSAK